jgi:predicted DsbA family dithiol-disulfide isomerase
VVGRQTLGGSGGILNRPLDNIRRPALPGSPGPHKVALGYAAKLGLDVAAFDRDRTSSAVAGRIRRDVDSGLASGQVLGTPTLFIDGVVHRGGYDPPTLLAALAP